MIRRLSTCHHYGAQFVNTRHRSLPARYSRAIRPCRCLKGHLAQGAATTVHTEPGPYSLKYDDNDHVFLLKYQSHVGVALNEKLGQLHNL